MSQTQSYPDIFSAETSAALHARIDKLTAETPALWGKMNVSQMLAHCSFPYLQAMGRHNKTAPFFMKLVVKLMFKKSMTNTVPYKQGLPTSPSFVVVDEKEFETEKAQLKSLITEFQQLGRNHFEGKAQASLGKLNSVEWNNLMYKHIDHHLRQFGV